MVGYMAVFGIFAILIYIGLIVLGVYLMVITIRFFKDKTQNDRELLHKMDELIGLLRKQSDKTL